MAEVSGMEAMGRPIPMNRRQEAYDWVRTLGFDQETASLVVGRVAEALERDKPYDAMREGMEHIDLTGTYRLFAVLLTPVPQRNQCDGCQQGLESDNGMHRINGRTFMACQKGRYNG